jgi:hypothetical protein
MYAFIRSGETAEEDDRVDAFVLGLHDLQQLTSDATISRAWRV